MPHNIEEEECRSDVTKLDTVVVVCVEDLTASR
jgi:hypothetical protein